MEVQLKGGKSVSVSDKAFGREYNEALIHQVVTAVMAGSRAGTKAQKTRTEVRGGGIKPWKQKGTGRARAGTIRSPVWRGGGKSFAAKPRDFSQKVNKKMYRGAMASILSELLRLERLVVVDSFSVSAPKTKELLSKLNELGMNDVLIINEAADENLYLAARNLYHVGVCDAASVDPVSLVGFSSVLMTVDSLKKFEERLA